MSMDFNGRQSDKPITDQEGVMFAAQPVWDRSRKRKGLGARKVETETRTPETRAPEARTFAAADEPMVLDTPVERAAPLASPPVERNYPRTEYAAMNPTAATTAPLAGEPALDTDGGMVAPIGIGRSTSRTASRSARAKSTGGVAPAAIAAGVVALGALGATGWYMSRGDTSGVPELTPGTTSSQVAAAPLAPVDPPAQMAANDALPPPAANPAPVAEPARTSAPARTSTARVRPAQASSAEATGVNASTTAAALPEGPQPYSSLNPGAAPAPAPSEPQLVTLPPPAAAPAAAVAPAAPQAVTPTPAPTPEAAPPTITPPQ